MSDALEAYISMILIRRFDFRCFDHFVQAFTRMPHTSFSNSTVHAFRCHQGPEIRSALHAIVAEGLQSAENTVGGRRTFSNMKPLQFGILSELFSSLLDQFSATSALQSPRFNLNDAIPISSSSDFFQFQRDLFHQYNIKAWTNEIGNFLYMLNSPSQGRKT